MISLLAIAAAAALFFGVDTAKLILWASILKSRVDMRKVAAASLLVLALLALPSVQRPDEPTPAPDALPLSLKGAFTGPTASEDAALVGALCAELADEIEWDGTQAHQYLKTGVQVDELRKAARILRCKGASIGDRQPAARDIIADFLDHAVGVNGGELTAQDRDAWVTAYRDIGRAASDAAR